MVRMYCYSRFMRRFLSALACLLAACGNDSNTSFDSGNGDSGADAAASFTLRVDPLTDAETVTIGLQNKSVQFHAYRKDSPNAQEVDVTAQVAWSVYDTLVAAPAGGGASACSASAA